MADDLFDSPPAYQPLAARMRPRSLADYIGQEHLLAPGKPLRDAIERGHLHSMILWGPPGVGKTTLARLFAEQADARFQTLSAVLSGVKDIRAAVSVAEQERASRGRKTILFVDEVHRFNKAQQDAFLPYVEDGTLIFIGATTENPSFELNNALLSRCRVYVLRGLELDHVRQVLRQALDDRERGLGAEPIEIDDEWLDTLARAADGDARKSLNLLEIAADLAEEGNGVKVIDKAVLTQVLAGDIRRFDKGGDLFYEQISALHKSVRGSSPDGALYWMARMLDGGCDPLYVARRVVRIASEDIGNADPRALPLALAAWETQERLGSPEGELAIAQALVYLAAAPKSNAVYNAFNEMMALVREHPGYEVPVHLRNAPTKLMKSMDYGAEYRYAHDEPGAYAAGESYLPPELADRRFYEPVDRGLEQRIREKLAYFRELDEKSPIKRYR
ncbi:replication-associated recombination protein A [Marinimicrobium sp. C2-29]|uniref:replication-associated recombination protein A n=1 Tax=Marinimicrobium sp. C2-29 TaxID=3139825 RepID=UPI003139CF81